MDFKTTFTSFSAKDINSTKEFYVNNLEARVVREFEGMVHLSVTDHDFVVYHKDDHTPATYTVLNFEVYDMDSAVSELQEKGIIFEQYDNDYIKTDSRGVSEMENSGSKMAWFKDPSGNILGLIEMS